MSTPKRKIGFYSLKLKSKEEDNDINPNQLKEVIDYINSIDKTERIYDNSFGFKFYLLDYIESFDNIQKLIFKTAKYHHRPPLINKENAVERENPKELTEGESELTHVALKYLDDEIVLIMEERRPGISISTIISYLIKSAKDFYSKQESQNMYYMINYSIIPKTDFFEELDKLERVTIGNIYVEKELFGSHALNFSNRIEEIQQSLIITIKAKRNGSIKETVADVLRQRSSSNGHIHKIRVEGCDDDKNRIVLDTDIIKRIEYVTVILNTENGIVNSEVLFDKFIEILDEY